MTPTTHYSNRSRGAATAIMFLLLTSAILAGQRPSSFAHPRLQGGLRDTVQVNPRRPWPTSQPRTSWERVSHQAHSPRTASSAVHSRVTYSRDMTQDDEWRSGKDTWERGQGDCEDYAAAVQELCAKSGHDARIMVVRSKTARQAHAVTMGKTASGRIWISSNGVYSEHQSLFDAKQEIARDLGWWAPDVEMTEAKTASGKTASTRRD